MTWKAAGVAVIILAATTAQAGQCREDVEERLGVLADAFDDQVRGLDIWSYSWGSIYGAVALTQAIALTTLNSENRQRLDLGVGAIGAAVGSASFFLLPLRFKIPMKRVRAQWDDPDRCALLARAEAVRTKVEKEQAIGKSWIGQAGNLLVNTGLALLLGLGFGHWEAGLISGFVGVVVGEVNLLTQPTKLGLVAEPPVLRLVPIVTREQGGAGFAFSF